MEIFVTGASGFVGRTLCRELLQQGHRLHCLVREGTKPNLPSSPQPQIVTADLFTADELTPLIRGVDAVIHLVGIIREFPTRGITFERLHHDASHAVIEATRAAGVKRYLHMSANGSRADAPSGYHRTKWQAEQLVRESGLDWTIFRPSLIYGAEDQMVNMIARQIRLLPLVPVIGDGSYRLQPVPVEQIATGFARALERDVAIGKTYHCGGADCLSYDQLLDLVGQALGKVRVHKLHQPLALMRPAIKLLQHLPFFPITADQLQMLLEGNCCDNRPWAADLELNPLPLVDGLRFLGR